MTDDVTTALSTPPSGRRMTRREILGLGGAVIAGSTIAAGWRQWHRHERGHRGDVFIGRAENYTADLAQIIRDGLHTHGIARRDIRNKTVLLKPNLVETADGAGHINTHPAVVLAAAEAFRRLDAREVIVAEGPGHRRDIMLVLEQAGLGPALSEAGLPFVDLNHDEPAPVANRGRWTQLSSLYLPQTIRRADWIVSLPKLKTHHWTGMTCAMKNFFGVMPGIAYGWPKNVLHFQGIDESILDINATVRPNLAIVDAIVGMEGDGPILGSPKPVGCLVMGRNLPAVDATCARIMKLNEYGIRYLKRASGRLGPIHPWNITQRGEPIDALATPFHVLDWPHLARVRTTHNA